MSGDSNAGDDKQWQTLTATGRRFALLGTIATDGAVGVCKRVPSKGESSPPALIDGFDERKTLAFLSLPSHSLTATCLERFHCSDPF